MRRGISRGASGVFVAVALAAAVVLLSRLTVPDEGLIPGLVLPPGLRHTHDGVVQAAPVARPPLRRPVVVPPTHVLRPPSLGARGAGTTIQPARRRPTVSKAKPKPASGSSGSETG